MGERSEQPSAVANRLSRQRDRERGVREVLLRLPNEVIAKLDAQAEQVGRSRAQYLAHVLAHMAIAADPVQVIEDAPRDLVDPVTTYGGLDTRRRGSTHPQSHTETV
jgi:hypothetical protein